jgi:hypothetical protein
MCLHTSLSPSMSVRLYVTLTIMSYNCLSVCFSGCLNSACLYICYLYIFLSLCTSLWLSVCFFVCMYVCMSNCTSLCLFVCFSVCLYLLCLPVLIPSICMSISVYLYNHLHVRMYLCLSACLNRVRTYWVWLTPHQLYTSHMLDKKNILGVYIRGNLLPVPPPLPPGRGSYGTCLASRSHRVAKPRPAVRCEASLGKCRNSGSCLFFYKY